MYMRNWLLEAKLAFLMQLPNGFKDQGQSDTCEMGAQLAQSMWGQLRTWWEDGEWT
jgi:hypothetical protein